MLPFGINWKFSINDGEIQLEDKRDVMCHKMKGYVSKHRDSPDLQGPPVTSTEPGTIRGQLTTWTVYHLKSYS